MESSKECRLALPLHSLLKKQHFRPQSEKLIDQLWWLLTDFNLLEIQNSFGLHDFYVWVESTHSACNYLKCINDDVHHWAEILFLLQFVIVIDHHLTELLIESIHLITIAWTISKNKLMSSKFQLVLFSRRSSPEETCSTFSIRVVSDAKHRPILSSKWAKLLCEVHERYPCWIQKCK